MLELKDTALELVSGGHSSMKLNVKVKISNSFNGQTANGNGDIQQIGNGNAAQVTYINVTGNTFRF